MPRLGSINANDGGWVNGKRSAGRVVDAPEPPIKFTIPKCESLNVIMNNKSIINSIMDLSYNYQMLLSLMKALQHPSLRMLHLMWN